MKKLILFTLLMSAVVLTFPATSHAKEEAPDFTFSDFACVITSEENAEVSIYYNYYGDFADREDFKTYIHYVYDGPDRVLKFDRCKEQKLTFPSEVEWNGKSYTVTSILPSKTGWYGKEWIVGITEVELPSTLKTIPDSNPFKHYRDLYRISMPESNEYFTTENGCLYNADCTTLYAVPCIPDNITQFKADARLQKIHHSAFYDSLIQTFDFSEAINLEPLDASFFNDFFYTDGIICYYSIYTEEIYFPPTVLFDVNNFHCFSDIKYYLPSSTQNVTTGYIPDGDYFFGMNMYYGPTYYIGTYSNGVENLVIRNGFLCIDNGKKLVAYNTHKTPFTYLTQGDDKKQYYPKKISFPEGIETIVADLFSDRIAPYFICNTNYILPSTLKCIEDYAFEGYKGSVIYVEGQPDYSKPHEEGRYENIGKIASRDAEGNEIENTLPENLEIMGKGCFMRSMLKEITVPNVKYIPELAFAGCEQLEKITFGAAVEEIELSAIFGEVADPKTAKTLITPEDCLIKCLSMTPPQLHSTNFIPTSTTFKNTVVVPDEAFDAYKEAWGDRFPNILTVSGINAVSADNSDSEEIFYNLNGQRVDGKRDTLAPGLYICRKAADKSTKVIIR